MYPTAMHAELAIARQHDLIAAAAGAGSPGRPAAPARRAPVASRPSAALGCGRPPAPTQS